MLSGTYPSKNFHVIFSYLIIAPDLLLAWSNLCFRQQAGIECKRRELSRNTDRGLQWRDFQRYLRYCPRDSWWHFWYWRSRDWRWWGYSWEWVRVTSFRWVHRWFVRGLRNQRIGSSCRGRSGYRDRVSEWLHRWNLWWRKGLWLYLYWISGTSSSTLLHSMPGS